MCFYQYGHMTDPELIAGTTGFSLLHWQAMSYKGMLYSSKHRSLKTVPNHMNDAHKHGATWKEAS